MYSKEYIDYLVHFHGDRDYFECHEILEEYWKNSDDSGKDSIWVGFILLAVSCYHHRRNNFAGAKRTLQKSISIIIDKKKDDLQNLGINKDDLINSLQSRLNEILNGAPYESLLLPIEDKRLLSICKETCLKKGFIWGEKSDFSNLEIMDRHIKRDRTGVLEERQAAIDVRKEQKRKRLGQPRQALVD